MIDHRHLLSMVIALAIGGCAGVESEKTPLRITPQSEVMASPVVREALPAPAAGSSTPAGSAPDGSVPGAASTSAEPASAAPSLAFVSPSLTPAPFTLPANIPAGTLYICTATVEGQVRQTAIEYAPRVGQLCSKHPEMGVCQYEREACRASGGRVFTAVGVEITRQTEAEYDKKVMRVRFRAA